MTLAVSIRPIPFFLWLPIFQAARRLYCSFSHTSCSYFINFSVVLDPWGGRLVSGAPSYSVRQSRQIKPSSSRWPIPLLFLSLCEIILCIHTSLLAQGRRGQAVGSAFWVSWERETVPPSWWSWVHMYPLQTTASSSDLKQKLLAL